MERNGWSGIRATLFEAPVPFEREDGAVLYLRTIMLRDHVARLPDDLQDPYLRAVIAETVQRHGAPYTADYVRLDIWAARSA